MLVRLRSKAIENMKPIDYFYVFLKLLYRKAITEEENVLLIAVGDTGSGKSISELGIVWWFRIMFYKKKFDFDKIAWDQEQFLYLVAYAKMKPGNCVVFEEVGTNISSRSWWANMDINGTLQEFRQDQLLVMMNAPDLGFIDKQPNALFHFYLEPTKKDKKNNIIWCKVRRIQINRMTGKPYFHRLLVVDRFGDRKIIDEIPIRVPPQWFIDKYNDIKREWRKKRDRERADRAKIKRLKEEKKRHQDLIDEDKAAEEIFNDWDKEDIRQARIENKFKVGRRIASRILDKVKEMQKKAKKDT